METLKAIIQYKLPMKESRDNLYSVSVGVGVDLTREDVCSGYLLL